MIRVLSCITFCALAPLAEAKENSSLFSDQTQYELFYEYVYRANFVERLVFECTADEDVWETFAYATAPITNGYKRFVLNTSIWRRDPFTGQRLVSLLWQELKLNLTRSSQADGDPAEPTLMAQRDVLELVTKYTSDIEALCDFVFWEEVELLELAVSDLFSDAKDRLTDEEYRQFNERTDEGLLVLQRLFTANPFN